MAGDPNTKLEGAGAAVEFGRAVQEQVERVVVGKADQTRLPIIALLADGHVLLDDVPGVAKTLLVRTLSAALSLSFTRTREALGSLGRGCRRSRRRARAPASPPPLSVGRREARSPTELVRLRYAQLEERLAVGGHVRPPGMTVRDFLTSCAASIEAPVAVGDLAGPERARAVLGPRRRGRPGGAVRGTGAGLRSLRPGAPATSARRAAAASP